MPFTAWNKMIQVVGFAFVLAMVLMGQLRFARAETLNVGGTGSAKPLIEQFAQAYRRLKPDITVNVIHPPMGSNGSIRAVLAGAIDLAVPGKPLTEQQKTAGGQDWELGRTPFIVVTAKESHPIGFTLERLAAIYRGEVTTWADGSPIRLVVRSPAESDTLILRNVSPLMAQAVDVALARPGMLVAANDLENLDLLERTPGSLGTTNLALMQSENRKLNVLRIDNKASTLDALGQGAYPYYKPLYIAHGPKLSSAADGFLAFVLSASSQEILKRAGYVPAPR